MIPFLLRSSSALPFFKAHRNASTSGAVRITVFLFSIASWAFSVSFSSLRLSIRSIIISTSLPCSRAFKRFSIASSASRMAAFNRLISESQDSSLQAAATDSAILRMFWLVNSFRHSATTLFSIACFPTTFFLHCFFRAFLQI